MGNTNPRAVARIKRRRRIRKKVRGTSGQPRLSVFRSAKHVYAQVIDDTRAITVAAASSVEKEFKEQGQFKSKTAAAAYVGQLVARRALEKRVQKVVFDRNGFLYHGRVKALSDGAREAGLKL